MEKIVFINAYVYDACFLYRQMRGEELEGLSVEELQQLEKNLETGLHRVLQTKVWLLNMLLCQFSLSKAWQ
jgi:hypothetical protein